ncbi:MAG: galK [Bacteroidota bacterium]|nr:galK [Bacteroidota bacterium]
MIDPNTLNEEFHHRYGGSVLEYFFAPGRVNLIGEHIDYNGGFVLPAAISLGITAIVNRRDDQTVRVYSKGFDKEAVIDLSTLSPPKKESEMYWQDYIIATLMVLKDHDVKLSGADIILDSDLPLASGLSSSAAVECITAFIFNDPFYAHERTLLALDAQHAEVHYVGVNCGIMDQFAVSHGKEKNAIMLNCVSLDYEYIPADFKTYELIIINSNKPRSLVESKYNERRKECDEAFKILKQFDPAGDLCHMHEISLTHLEDETLYKRAKHAVLENKRVLHAANALKNGNIEVFGQLLIESHISLDEDYEVTGEELNTIVHYSTKFEDCIGARMTGAGFGGSCIALVKKEKVDRFISYVGSKYEQKTGLKAEFYKAKIVDGVNRI